MKFSLVLAASAAALGLMAIAPAASATEEVATITEIDGTTLSTPLTFEFDTANPYPGGLGGVVYAAQSSNEDGIWNITLFNYGSAPGDSPYFGGIGIFGSGFPVNSYGQQGYFDGDTSNTFTINTNGVVTYNSALKTASLLTSSGTSITISAAPEPATWMLMFAGVGVAGAALRYGRRDKTAAVAA